jgi:hypothetical protein
MRPRGRRRFPKIRLILFFLGVTTLAVWVLGEPMISNDNNVLFNNNINNNFELSRVKNKNGLKLGCGCSDVGPVESSG